MMNIIKLCNIYFRFNKSMNFLECYVILLIFPKYYYYIENENNVCHKSRS